MDIIDAIGFSTMVFSIIGTFTVFAIDAVATQLERIANMMEDMNNDDVGNN